MLHAEKLLGASMSYRIKIYKKVSNYNNVYSIWLRNPRGGAVPALTQSSKVKFKAESSTNQIYPVKFFEEKEQSEFHQDQPKRLKTISTILTNLTIPTMSTIPTTR